ncbi:conjugal transfer protein [Agathobaculum sp. LCP25S3_E8]|uniref:conjugal transfer protein n=1 Tax=Agathobaculum sp. LCP25S3_E8 TaxID=3438735 RepID=UPI003F8EF534
MSLERQGNEMFQKKNRNQEKQKKPRVLHIGTRRPVVAALWALLICAFAFAVYKNFTAVDTHTVHETTVVQQEVTDTNAIESFVTNFAKVYYSWEQSAASIEQRTENLKYYLTDELQALNADTVRSDVPVSSKVEDVQIWSVEQTGDKVYKVVYSVSQKVVNGEESSTVTSVYEVSVYVDDAGDMVIIQSPTITGKPAKSDYSPKAAEPDGTVSAQESTEITEFLTTFFTLYPSASEQELSYYVSSGALPVIENDSYVFAALVNTVFTKSGDTVTANVSVQYLDQQTGMTQISQFVVELKKSDKNWEIIS